MPDSVTTTSMRGPAEFVERDQRGAGERGHSCRSAGWRRSARAPGRSGRPRSSACRCPTGPGPPIRAGVAVRDVAGEQRARPAARRPAPRRRSGCGRGRSRAGCGRSAGSPGVRSRSPPGAGRMKRPSSARSSAGISWSSPAAVAAREFLEAAIVVGIGDAAVRQDALRRRRPAAATSIAAARLGASRGLGEGGQQCRRAARRSAARRRRAGRAGSACIRARARRRPSAAMRASASSVQAGSASARSTAAACAWISVARSRALRPSRSGRRPRQRSSEALRSSRPR